MEKRLDKKAHIDGPCKNPKAILPGKMHRLEARRQDPMGRVYVFDIDVANSEVFPQEEPEPWGFLKTERAKF